MQVWLSRIYSHHPMHELIKGVIKAANENHDWYHYKPTGVLSENKGS